MEKYKLVGITVHPGPSKMPVFSCGLKLGKFRFLLAILMLGAYCIKHPKSLVLSHYYSSYGLASLLVPCRPVIFCWGSDVNVLNAKYPRLAKTVARLANIRAKVLIVPSMSMKRKLVNDGISEEKIRVLQYGIDLETFRDMSTMPTSVEDSVNVASIRNGDPLYQIEKIVDAFNRAEFGNKDATLHILGSDHSFQYDYRILGPRKKIVNHGFLSKDKFYQVIKSCEVFVSIPVIDGLSLSVLQALYLGVEPILSDVGSYRDDFAEINPHLVNADVSVEVLANSISTVVSDTFAIGGKRRSSNRIRYKKFVRDNFNKDDAKQSLALILSEVLKGKSGL